MHRPEACATRPKPGETADVDRTDAPPAVPPPAAPPPAELPLAGERPAVGPAPVHATTTPPKHYRNSSTLRVLLTAAAAFLTIFLFLRTAAVEPFGVPTGS